MVALQFIKKSNIKDSAKPLSFNIACKSDYLGNKISAATY